MKDPVFLSREAVDHIHETSLRAFGGAVGVRDETALASAIAQPMHVFHHGTGDLFDLAAAYAFHLAENQPSIDGNQRTGLLSALNFLALNGHVGDQQPMLATTP